MASPNKKILSTLKSIRADFQTVGSGDQQGIAKSGQAIEQLLSEFEGELQVPAESLQLCLQVLEAVYSQPENDFEGRSASIVAGLVAAEHWLASRDSDVTRAMLDQACVVMREMIDGDVVESTASPYVDAVSKIVANIESITNDDLGTIVTAGASIEDLINTFPEETAESMDVLVLGLSGLQKAYSSPDAGFKEIVELVGVVIRGVESSAGGSTSGINPEVIAELKKMISEESDQSVQEGSGDSAPFASTDTEAARLSSLDDIGSLLMQVGPEDRDDIQRICDALKRISDDTEDTGHRKMLVKAARDLDKFLKGKSKNVSPALDSLSNAINEINAGKIDLGEPVATAAAAESQEPAQPEAAPAPAAPALTVVLEEDNSLLNEFIIESSELIEAAEQSLLTLENDPEDIESINTVFRAFHSIKGTSAFLGLTDMTAFAHLAESLLSRMRDREIRCTGGYADLALRSVDVIKELLVTTKNAVPGKPMPLPADYSDLLEILKNPEAKGVSAEGSAKAAERTEKASGSETSEIAEIVRQNSQDSSVRVRTDRLDSLIDMIGELVIAQSMLAEDGTITQGTHPDLSRKISHAGKIVRELQDLSMSMRMVPLKSTFQKMARIVRDVAKKCGKQVEFVTVGEDTEIDRNMVDIIADPLVHMVRNAVDHGIEQPEKRSASGKPTVGQVRISAYHAGGDVVVELADDGAGLDRDRIVAKAIENGLIDTDAGMSDSEIFALIFAPGFSTADVLTDVSGRGVGMDVVRRNIEAMRGRVQISSKKGEGSVFTIRLPLTLAITDGMLVRVGEERFIIPIINIQLSFQPTKDMMSTVAGKGELVNLRGELLQVLRLHKLFDIKGALNSPTDALLTVIADGRRRCALLVDELLGQQQVVTKTLGDGIGKVNGVSGGAILGDGRVGLILDAAEIVSMSRNGNNSSNRRGDHLRLAA